MKLECKRDGATGFVVLTKKWAFKFPGVHHRGHFWEGLLRGLLANMQERDFSRIQNPFKDGGGYPETFMLPTSFALWGGWMNIQPRVAPLSLEQWEEFRDKHWDGWREAAEERMGFIPPVELKRSSFGLYTPKGEDTPVLLAIDLA